MSGSAVIPECRVRPLLLGNPNKHATGSLAVDSRQLNILCSLLMFYDGYGSITYKTWLSVVRVVCCQVEVSATS